MVTEILDTGLDIHVQEFRPTTANPDSPTPPLSATTGKRKRIALRFGELATKVRGRVITSAFLEGRTRDAHGSYTLTVHAIAAGFTDQVTWNGLLDRGVVSGGVTATVPARAAGERWSVDVSALVQQVANGATHYGFRLAATDGGGDRRFFGFDTASLDRDWWRLVITYEEESDAPTGLVPDGGVVGVQSPVLTWVSDEPDPDDVDGTSQAQYRVQVDHNADPNGLSPTYDSENVNSGVSSHNLASPPSGPSYTPPATVEAPRWWRVSTRPVNGQWSDWSDWASFPYVPHPVVEIIAPVPTGGVALVTDSNPLVQIRVPGSIETWRVVLLPDATNTGASGLGAATDRTYDSQDIDAPAPVGGFTVDDHEIPATTRRNGVKVPTLADDGLYQLVVQVEDRADRVASVGDPAYSQVSLPVRYDDDAGILRPTRVTARQEPGPGGNPHGEPTVVVTMERTSAPEVWEISRNGTRVALIEHDDSLAEDGPVTVVRPGVWQWRHVGVRPQEAALYAVRAQDRDSGGKLVRSPERAADEPVTVLAQHVWLVLPYPIGGLQALQLRGDTSVFERYDQRETYTPIGEQAPFDILYAQMGVEWDKFTGTFGARMGGQDPQVAVATARLIEERPLATLRLIWGDRSIPVQLRDFNLIPDESMTADNQRHRVTFGGWQTGEIVTSKPAR